MGSGEENVRQGRWRGGETRSRMAREGLAEKGSGHIVSQRGSWGNTSAKAGERGVKGAGGDAPDSTKCWGVREELRAPGEKSSKN